MRTLQRQVLFVGLLLALVLAPVQAAFAHAQLLSTSPAENAVTETAPQTVDLNFNEPVTPLAIRLYRPGGDVLDLTESSQGGDTTSVALPADLSRGTHVLSWRVVSADGHPIAGSLIFSIGEITVTAAPLSNTDATLSATLWITKTLLFGALFFGLGGALFGILVPLPAASRNLASSLSVLGLLLAPLTLGLQGLDALGQPLSSIFDPATWIVGFETSYGATAVALFFAFALALLSLRLRAGAWSMLFGIGAALFAALSLALSGHASAAAPQWLTRPAVFLHIASLLFWIGALFPLAIMLRDRSDDAYRALASFSRIIPFAIAPLILSGLSLAVIQMGMPGPNWFSPYGVILAGKLLLLAVLFALAIWNRIRLTEPALAGNQEVQDRLRRSIRWEMVIVAISLALVALWRFTPPPRALADLPPPIVAEPLIEHLFDDTTLALITLTPGSAGPVELELQLFDMEHMPKPALSASIIMSNPELGIEPIRAAATEIDDVWHIDDFVIPAPGDWLFEAEIRVSRFELARPSGEISVP